MASAIADITTYWDTAVDRWLAGESAVPEDLRSWFTSYRGKGDGASDVEALPELWHGPLDPARCRVVFLSLNPGRVQPEFQCRDGIYASEIRNEFGSYTAWAASWPYLREPWTASPHHSPHAHLPRRLKFARHWSGDPSLPASAMVHFEMYPWHSTKLNAPLKPHRQIVERFVLNPIGELRAPALRLREGLAHAVGARSTAANY